MLGDLAPAGWPALWARNFAKPLRQQIDTFVGGTSAQLMVESPIDVPVIAASTRKPGKREKGTGPWLTAANWLLVAAAALVPLALDFVPFGGPRLVLMSGLVSAHSAALGLLVGGALLCWSVALARGEVNLKRVPYGWLLAAFVVLVLASVATALDRIVAVFGDQYAEQGMLAVAAYVAVFVLATQIIEGRRDLLRILQAVALSGGIVALFGVLQSVGLPFYPYELPSYLADRGTSTLGNPDILGTFLIVPLLISLGLSVATTGRRRWLWMTCTAVTSASLLLTQTRGAWLGALVALVIFSIVVYRSPRSKSGSVAKWIGAASVVVVGVVIAVYKAATGAQPLLSRLTQAGAAGEGGRLLVWSEVLKVIWKYPILGVGPDNIEYGWYQVSTSAVVHALGIDGVANDAHSYWLGTAVSSGIVSAVLLLALVVVVLVGSRRAVTDRLAVPGAPDRVAYSALWAGVVGLCVALVFSVFVTPLGLILWLSLGLLAVPKARPLPAGVSRDRMRYAAVAVSAVLGLSLVVWGGATGLSSSVENVSAGSLRDPVQAARTASRIAPWRHHPLYLERQLLEARGASTAEIVPVLDQLIKLAPREYFYYYYLARAYVLDSQPKLAIAIADKGLAVYPGGLRLIAERALAQSMLGDFAPAERDAAAAWSVARDVVPARQDPFVGIIYAQVLLSEGKKADAKAVVDQLQAQFPGNVDVESMRSAITSAGK